MQASASTPLAFAEARKATTAFGFLVEVIVGPVQLAIQNSEWADGFTVKVQLSPHQTLTHMLSLWRPLLPWCFWHRDGHRRNGKHGIVRYMQWMYHRKPVHIPSMEFHGYDSSARLAEHNTSWLWPMPQKTHQDHPRSTMWLCHPFNDLEQGYAP